MEREYYLVLRGQHRHQMTDEVYYQFCHDNGDLRIERNEPQEIIIMSSSGSLWGKVNADLSPELIVELKSDTDDIADLKKKVPGG